MPSVPPTETRAGFPEPGQPPPQHPPPDPPEADDIPPWPVWTAPAAIAAGFGVWIVVSVIVDVGAKAGGSSLAHPSPVVSLIANVLSDASFVAAALYFARLGLRPRRADFGYRAIGWGTGIVVVFAAGVGYYVLTALYANLLHFHGNEKLPKELGVGKSTVALIGASIFVCVVAPIAEEFFFRGFIFGALRRIRIEFAGHRLGTWVAAILTGILFGLAHTGSASSRYLIPLGLFGFVLCLVRWRTRSLYPCMALHSMNNALALGVSQLNWDAFEVIALMVGSLLVIAALTGPLAERTPALA